MAYMSPGREKSAPFHLSRVLHQFFNSIQMIDAWINPDLIQNRDPGFLDSAIQGPHLGET